MTSASKLFYNRRSRPGRASATATATTSAVYPGGTPPGFDILNHHGHNNHHVHHPGRRHAHSHRHDLDGFDHPLRRSSRACLVHEQRPRGSSSIGYVETVSNENFVMVPIRHGPKQERVSLRIDAGASQAGPSSSVNVSTESNSRSVSLRIDAGASQAGPSSSVNVSSESNSRRSGHTSTDRLPGSVLLARDRLLERLRGVSLSGGRQNTAALPSNNYEEHTVDDQWRLADVSDWGVDTLTHSSDVSADNTDVALQSDRNDKKPRGLTQDMINRLDLETYCNIVSADGLNQDCSICLESFLPGDKLLHLPCEHRFHYPCLDPWVRTCGDCPYCRKAIVRHNSETGKEKAYY